MEIKGTVIQILEIETGQGKKEPWQKQCVILETPGQYRKKVAVHFWGAQVDTITRINHDVTVHVNPESREFNGKWYTELRAWKVEQGSGGVVSRKPESSTPTNKDDMPF